MKSLRVALLILACAPGLAQAQANLGRMRDAPSAKFKPEDFEMLWATVDEVSRGKTVGESKSWENVATSAGGTIKLLKVFTSTDGRDCRTLQVTNYAGTLKGKTKQIVCASPQGEWVLDAGAKPAPAAKP
jgi:hypothetical protein